MATIDGKSLYKVPATGRMTTANVISTCKSAAMDAACYFPYYGDSKCTLIRSNIIFSQIRNVICPGLEYWDCKPLQNVFVYMTKKNGHGEGGEESSGISNGHWDIPGSEHFDKFALCVT